jgi:hypothetical protein
MVVVGQGRTSYELGRAWPRLAPDGCGDYAKSTHTACYAELRSYAALFNRMEGAHNQFGVERWGWILLVCETFP